MMNSGREEGLEALRERIRTAGGETQRARLLLSVALPMLATAGCFGALLLLFVLDRRAHAAPVTVLPADLSSPGAVGSMFLLAWGAGGLLLGLPAALAAGAAYRGLRCRQLRCELQDLPPEE